MSIGKCVKAEPVPAKADLIGIGQYKANTEAAANFSFVMLFT